MLRVQYLEKLKSNNNDEFVSQSRTYKENLQRESVSREIKKDLIRPIENMETKLEAKDRLTGALSNVRPALIDKAVE